jgi:chromosome segregation ATPase
MQDGGRIPETDLEKTDTLPVLTIVARDADVGDDAEPLDPETIRRLTAKAAVRPAGLQRPPPGEVLRSLEQRIARLDGEYRAVLRHWDRAKEGEAAAVARLKTLTAESSALSATLETHQTRVRELEAMVADKANSVDLSRTRAEEAMRESTRLHEEARTLRDALAARDATIVQVLHSLEERDAQLTALQREHARIIPILESRSKSTEQLDTELQQWRRKSEERSLELKAEKDARQMLEERLKQIGVELEARTADARAAQRRGEAYLEVLRTRAYRHEYELNRSREPVAKSDLSQSREIEELRALVKSHAAARDTAMTEARAAVQEELQEALRQLEAARRQSLEQSGRFKKLQIEADSAQLVVTDLKKATEQLGAHAARIAELERELEGARNALAERDARALQLEHSGAAVLPPPAAVPGFAEASLPEASLPVGLTPPQPTIAARLTRLDGENRAVHELARRTRIGRASGCELQIEAQSISRHHAIVLTGPRGAIIEDTNSTNGVFVNGLKVTRQLLRDGDAVTIGDVKFRFSITLPPG